MPNVPQDNADGVIEAKEARLPEPRRAPPEGLATAEALQQPALSEEELRERQDAMGTRRKPAGPPLEGGPLSESEQQPADVPETDVTLAEDETESQPEEAPE